MVKTITMYREIRTLDWDKEKYSYAWQDPERAEKLNEIYLRYARMSEPDGATCGFCGKVNEYADDCGFYYLTPSGDEAKPACKECCDGPMGELHRKRYGLGER